MTAPPMHSPLLRIIADHRDTASAIRDVLQENAAPYRTTAKQAGMVRRTGRA